MHKHFRERKSGPREAQLVWSLNAGEWCYRTNKTHNPLQNVYSVALQCTNNDQTRLTALRISMTLEISLPDWLFIKLSLHDVMKWTQQELMVSVCVSPSTFPHDSTRKLLDEFLLNLIWTSCHRHLPRSPRSVKIHRQTTFKEL